MYNWKLEKKNIKSKILVKNKFVMSFNLNKELKNGIELKFKQKLIIFDLDGVLINSLPNMKFALANTAIHINQKISFKRYRKYIGLPFEKILRELNVKGDYKKISLLFNVFYEKINKLKIDKKKLYSLKKLKKYFLAIFTSKDKIRTLKI